MEKLTGGCLCGAVRYETSAKPLMTRACWCRTCQYYAAGNATVNMVFKADAITIIGNLSDYASTADSGNSVHRKFCPHCGVQVISSAEQRPNFLVVRAGTLDDASQVQPEALIWTSSAPKWAYLDPSIPHFEKQPPVPVAINN